MSTLADLIAAVVAARALPAEDNYPTLENAEGELVDYLVSRAADIALRERLERAVVEAHRHASFMDKKGAYEPFRTLEKAEIELTAFLVAHADDKAQP